MIRTILLDVGQVVVALDFPAALRRIMQHTSLPAEEIQRRFQAHGHVVRYECGQLSTEEFYRTICALLEMEATQDEFESGWAEIFSLNGPAGQCVSAEFFRRLKQKHRVVALSNTNEMHWRYLESVMPLIREFDDYVLSYRVGAMKPDPVIYKAALSQTGCRADEVFFVDDLEANIEAAAALGIEGIVYKHEDQLREELERRGLL